MPPDQCRHADFEAVPASLGSIPPPPRGEGQRRLDFLNTETLNPEPEDLR